ncbi:MAG: FAD-dependent oxidoreductase [Spirochaetales bacterium]|nr:FAD-dependent oxidoreductase [Spirochaetales bacterium]MCF7937815.1 FAD-dependent oxidoreductase [Spirochaetales bacterium]
MKPVVVAGAVAAGMSAASIIKRSLPDREVIVYGREENISYGACGMPYFIGGEIESYEKLAVLKPSWAREKRNIDLHIRHEVTKIDRDAGKVEVKDLESGNTFWQEYEKLVIATGARAIMPPIPGADLEGVLPLKQLEDSVRLDEYLNEKKPRKAVIIGGGYIGVESAEAFRNRGMDVTIVEALPRILNIVDEEMSEHAAEELENNEVAILSGTKVVGIEGSGSVERVKLETGETLEADVVLMSVGVRPNTEIAEEAGIELGDKKAVMVDQYLKTNDPDIYAAGDCAVAYHNVLGRPVHVPLALGANRQGRMAGENIVAELNGNPLNTFPGILGSAMIKIFDGEVAKTGIGETEIEQYGLKEVDSVSIKAHTLAGYYPGNSPMWVKIFYHAHSKKLMGGQIYGAGRSVLRINILATAISAGMRLEDLYNLDLGYAPPFSPVWDPLLVAARQGMK